MAELIEGGYVWRGVEERKYYPSGLLAVRVKGTQPQALVYAAHDPLQKLVQQVRWPSDLFVRDGVDMVLIDTTQSMSPYSLRPSKIGSRVPILLSPSGHAVLAEMSQEDREGLYEELGRRGELKRQLRLCGKSPAEIVAEVEKRGVAFGESNFGSEKPNRSRFLAIAAPIVLRSNVVGAVAIWWPRSADGTSDVQVNQFRDALQVATSAIAVGLELMSISTGAKGRGYSENANQAELYTERLANDRHLRKLSEQSDTPTTQ